MKFAHNSYYVYYFYAILYCASWTAIISPVSGGGRMTTFGERLAGKRREKGWSQRELARHAGVSHTIVADVEKGARHSIGTDAAKKLARALGVSVDYLIGTFEDDEPGDGKPAGVALVGA